MDDWGYFAVPPGYRPLDLKEFKRQLYEDKIRLWKGDFPTILHEMSLDKLRMFYLEETMIIAKSVPRQERDLYHGVKSVEVIDINHVIIKDAIESVLSCLEEPRHQKEYERVFGVFNLDLALNNLRALESSEESHGLPED